MKNYAKPSITIDALFADNAIAADDANYLAELDPTYGEVSIAVGEGEYWQ